MNLPKAIEISYDILLRGSMVNDPDDIATIKLGIKAIEFFQEFQKVTGNHQDARLPGETEE